MPGLLKFRCFLMGSQSRLIQCGDVLLEKGHQVLGVISAEPTIQRWAKEKGLAQITPDGDLVSILRREPFDLFLSIDNYWKVPNEVFALARKFAINFHDGPLPRYAGVNATNWAIMNQEKTHGLTWHVITDVMDAGDILKQVVFPLSPRETALTLNAKCYEKSIQSFAELIDELAEERVVPIRQSLENRSYYGRWKRPRANCAIDWSCSAESIDALFRGLDRGPYPNPLGLPKLYLGDRAVIVKEMEILESKPPAAPGTITLVDAEKVQVATETREVELRGFISFEGASLSPAVFLAESGLRVSDQLPKLEQERVDSITKIHSELSRHEDFWTERLRRREPIELPYEKRHAPGRGKRKYLGARLSIPERALSCPDISKDPGYSILAAVILYLGRIANKTGFDIDFQDAALRQKVSGAEAFFAAQVPLHIEVEHQKGFREFCEGVSVQLDSIRAHGSYARDLPFRDPGLRSASSQGSSWSAPVALERVTNLSGQKPHTDADLVIVVPDDGKECVWWYDEEALGEEPIGRMQEQFAVLLNDLAMGQATPVAELAILPERERHKLLIECNATQADYPKDLPLHQLFEAQVERAPEAVAIAGPSLGRGSALRARLTYAELNHRANQLARHLQTLGVGPEVLVAVCMERTVEMVTGLLAILKVGGAYVPLDPSYPPDRTAFILEETQAPVVLTQLSFTATLPRHQARVVCVDDPNLQTEIQNLPSHNPQFPRNHPHPSNLAYVIFTSGSTGRPKGVAIEHRSAVTLLHWAREVFAPAELAGVLASTSICFDLSVFELFVTLSWGGKVILAENALQLSSLPEANEVTLINTVPSAMTELLRMNAVPPSVRVVNLAGEPLQQSLVDQLYHLPTIHKVYDLYGPSETTTYSTFALRRRDGVATIGRPIANTQVYLLDAQQQLVPFGGRGELYIGGDGLARGYLHWPEMTAERFIPNPFSTVSGSRLYKTGDLARYLPDGNLEYLGRLDHQVKVRGFRIELGEIEAALRQHPAVGQAVVIAREDAPGDKRLVAYVILNPDYQADASEAESRSEHLSGRQAISGQAHQEMVEVEDRRLSIFVRSLVPQLRGLLEKKLPQYMVPSAFVLLEAFPLTPNGKLDRKALPSPGDSRPDLEPGWAPPDSQTEQVIARVWEELLGVSRVGRDGNFFDLGGHSLLLMRVRNKLEQAFARQLPVVEMFRHPTVRSLAKYLTNHEAEATTLARNGEQIARYKESAQRRLQRRKRIAVEEGQAR